MNVKLEDRPLSSVKDQVVDVLIHNYSHGVITEEAFERRLDVAMTSQNPHEVMQQIDDLSMPDSSEIKEQKRKHFDVAYTTDSEVEPQFFVNIFGGNDRKGKWVVPTQLSSFSMCGGSTIDMTNAIFSSKEITIKCFCLFGGDTIYVPPGAQVVSSMVCIFGGITDSASNLSGSDGPIIRIEGLAICGGIAVKVKTNFKKMFVNFANQMKTMMENRGGV